MNSVNSLSTSATAIAPHAETSNGYVVKSWNKVSDLGKKLLKDTDYMDLKLICSGGESLGVHRSVVATYEDSYFYLWLKQTDKEVVEAGIIDLKEFNQSIVSILRNFLYGAKESANVDFKELFKLRELADFLLLNDQSKICLETIRDAIISKPDLYADAWIYLLSQSNTPDQKIVLCFRYITPQMLLRMSSKKKQEFYDSLENHKSQECSLVIILKGLLYHYFYEDYEKAFNCFKEAAEKKDSWGQGLLGFAFHLGRGVKVDLEEALKNYELAIQQNDSSGKLWKSRLFIDKDPDYSERLLTEAANEKNPLAQCELGDLLLKSEKIEEALLYLKEAADQKNVYALDKLGYVYRIGEHVPKDISKAIGYYTLASECGSRLALYNLGLCFLNGQGVVKDQKKAIEYFKQAAEKGNEDAKKKLIEINATAST